MMRSDVLGRPFLAMIFSLTITSFFIAPTILAQYKPEDPALARADLVVPDNPAFNILGLTTSEMLRPSSTRELGVIFSPTIPGSAAVEIAPLLWLSKPDLGEYSTWLPLYSARISMATASAGVAHSVALGLRFAIIDESDPRVNPDLHDLYRTHLDHRNDAAQECLDAHPEWLSLSGEERDEKINEYLADKVIGLRDRLEDKNWNGRILEVGAAISGESPDSLYKNLKVAQYATWLTLAWPIGEIGQFLLGAKGSSQRTVNNEFGYEEFALSARCYMGVSSTKGYFEFEFHARDALKPVFSGVLGTELNVLNGVWFDASMGLEQTSTSDAKMTTAFNVRFATPEIR